jgi:hypothetical protein
LADLTVKLSLKKVLIPVADRDSEEGLKRGIGTILSKHVGETFVTETDERKLRLRLEKGRPRIEGSGPRNHYRFVVEDRRPLDEES